MADSAPTSPQEIRKKEYWASRNAVIRAAKDWWASKRPVGWTKEQHVASATVNTSTDDERVLAICVSMLRDKP